MLLSITCFASESNKAKYETAARTAANAALIQSGYEADFAKVKDASKNIIIKWAKDNSLHTVLSTTVFVGNVVYKERLRIRTGNVVFIGTPKKVEATWTLQF